MIKELLLKALQPIKEVAQRAFMKKGKRVEQIVPEHVQEIARTMESLLIMSEDMEPSSMLTFECSHEQLASFVCYMRQLDTEYRALAANAEAVRMQQNKLAMKRGLAAAEEQLRGMRSE